MSSRNAKFPTGRKSAAALLLACGFLLPISAARGQGLFNLSVSPNANPSPGGDPSGTFHFTVNDVTNAHSVGWAQVLFNSGIVGAGACYIHVSRPGNAVYLIDDAGTHLGDPLTPGGAGTAENSQCALDAASITITYNSILPGRMSFDIGITFKPAFKGSRNIYMNSGDSFQGVSTGWQLRGTWTAYPVLPDPPTADSVSPNSGAAVSQLFTFQSSDVNGAAYIATEQVLFNNAIDGSNACYVFYANSPNMLYLANDAGTGWNTIQMGTQGTVENSQCALDAGASSATASGNTLTLTLALSFKTGFSGTKNIYLLASDSAGQSSGWQPRGTWMTSAAPIVSPANVSVPSAGGTGTLMINVPAGVAWTAASNAPAWIAITSGASGIGNGTTNYTVAANATGAARTGTITVNGQTASIAQNATDGPLNISMSPSGRTAATQTFTFRASDSAGFGNLWMVEMLFNTAIIGSNACYFFYLPGSNAFKLMNDAGDA